MTSSDLSVRNVGRSLIFRLILLVGLVLLLVMCAWADYNINSYREKVLDGIIKEVDRLGSTIRLGAHYAMMLNSRDDINEIIKNIGRQEQILNIRIFNKQGEIKFSNLPEEVDRKTTIKDDACFICHKTDPPLREVELASRTRMFTVQNGSGRSIGLISPIYNEAGCSSETCHYVHPPDKQVLGALDVVVSLKDIDDALVAYRNRTIAFASVSFLATSAIIALFLVIFVNRPIRQLINRTKRIGRGQFSRTEHAGGSGEIGLLSAAISNMEMEIKRNQDELKEQKFEYQELFEQVPCFVTVQDRDLHLIRCNREFRDHFSPGPGDKCYKVYKGRTERCDPCPVLLTYNDGMPRFIEETGVAKDGRITHWFGRTAAVRDRNGDISAVMEMSVDITEIKHLEEEIRKSERKYRSIFHNMPHPIFVLDRKNLMILDCNDSMTTTYGFTKDEIINTSFLHLFEDVEQQQYALEIRTSDSLNLARQLTKEGRSIIVNIRVSPWEYLGRQALLVSVSDITKRRLAEQQLLQASKMATLGEMATGVAHELNQPLTVIKMASLYIANRIKKKAEIKEETLKMVTEDISGAVDRASKIISHLQEFGYKADVKRERVHVNTVLGKAYDLIGQQLKGRSIQVEKDLRDVPDILADANRLEQVFINLIINARDAIKAKEKLYGEREFARKIMLRTKSRDGKVVIEIEDTGTGIPKTIVDKIFEPFFTTKKVGCGTGLGLSISYGIVQDYDGSIRVDTVEGEGTVFTIEFPVWEEAGTGKSEASARS